MMKRIVVCLAILGVVSSGAYATSMIKALAPAGANTTSQAKALSADGTLVGGGSGSVPTSWDMTDPNNPVITTVTSFASGTGTLMTGIGRSGTNVYTSGVGSPHIYNGTTTAWSGLQAHTGLYDKSVIAGFNSTATTDTDQWVGGRTTYGTVANKNRAYLWQRSNGSLPKYVVIGTGESMFNSVAAFGTSVRGVGYTTGTTKYGVYSNDGGAFVTIPNVSDANYNTVVFDGQGSGISEDGEWLCGYGKPTLTGGAKAAFNASYRWDYGTGASELLEPVEGMAAVFLANGSGAAQSVVFDIATDGFAVGYDWNDVSSNRAAIWLPGETTARLLLPYLNSLSIDTTGWNSLDQAFSTTKVGNDYVITGNGVYEGAARAFYVVIPEPATLIFMSLGCLFLRRRRMA